MFDNDSLPQHSLIGDIFLRTSTLMRSSLFQFCSAVAGTYLLVGCLRNSVLKRYTIPFKNKRYLWDANIHLQILWSYILAGCHD